MRKTVLDINPFLGIPFVGDPFRAAGFYQTLLILFISWCLEGSQRSWGVSEVLFSFKLVVSSSNLVFFPINPAKYLRCNIVSNLWHPLHSCTKNASCVSLSDLLVAKSRENFNRFRLEHLLRKANEGWEDHFLPQPMALPEHSKAERGM